MPREDIMSFWSQTRSELAEVPVEAVVEYAEPDGIAFEGPVKTFANHRVVMSSFEGTRIRAWLTIPVGEPPDGGWPAVMSLPGYGGVMPLPVHITRYGYVTLALYPRGQGESEAEWQLPNSSKVTHNIEDRDRYYYRGAYMDCIRGLDFLSERPDVNKRRLGVWGRSQGGGLTLAVSALDDRVAAAVAELPWPCSFPAALDVTAAPYSELNDYLAEHPRDRDALMANLEFFDPTNLADAIECPALVNAAVIDEVHPYRTVMPAFIRIPPVKSLIVYDDMEHGGRNDFAVHAMAWLDRYLR